MHSETSTWVVLAHLLRPQGRKGELLSELLTDFPERFVGRENLLLVPPGFAGDMATAKPVQIISSWLPVGKNKGRVVLGFAGIDTISAAEGIAGLDVVVSDDHRVPLDDESIYINDLVGCTLFDGATEIGEITDVQFSSASDGDRLSEAAPLLFVQSENNGEILVPFVKAFLKTIDLSSRRLVMSLPVGLVEVNRSS